MMLNKTQSHGFSLVELMVAMVIGLIIMGGAFSMYGTSRDTQQASEVQMDMVADARFAIDMIAYDLRHAGAWGGTNKDSLIQCRSTDTSCPVVPTAVADDCVAGWTYNLSLPVFATDGADGNPYSGSCIRGGENYLANTDILEVRYADSNEPNLIAGQVYVRSNFTNGRVFVGDAEPALDGYNASPLTKNNQYHAYAYYVSDFTDVDGDGIPSLRRVALVNGPALENQTLVSGVTDLQVQFGIDLDGDLAIDRYVDANTIAAADWENVYAAKIWLMMRSDETQELVKETSYSLAGTDVTLGADGFRYFMVSSVVNLRNLKKQ